MTLDLLILSNAVPAFLVLSIAETIYLYKERHEKNGTTNILITLGLGSGAILINLFLNGLVLILYTVLYKYRLFTIPNNIWWAWGLCFFGDDLSYYWFHRCSHKIRFMWASHSVHHSSEAYTLTGGLRVPWTGNISGSFLFWAWMPLLGFAPSMVVAMQALSVIYQFWLHTELINRMPRWFEAVFNTPSHHRVHHASDTDYLDKNHAGTLIIWDKIFGTFLEETFAPTYGLAKHINSSNPLIIAFTEWKNLFMDFRKARKPRDYFNYIFNSPGWSNDGSSKTTRQLQSGTKK